MTNIEDKIDTYKSLNDAMMAGVAYNHTTDSKVYILKIADSYEVTNHLTLWDDVEYTLIHMIG